MKSRAAIAVILIALSACASTGPASPQPAARQLIPKPPPTLASAIAHAARLGPAGESTAVALSFALSHGRTISIPPGRYPRSDEATPAECRNWRLIGEGIHWPDLDEDISVENLLSGKVSGESQRSLQEWITQRQALRQS